MTVKVHLKTEEKKRAAAVVIEAATPSKSAPEDAPAPAPVAALEQPGHGETPAQDTEQSNEEAAAIDPTATGPVDEFDEVSFCSDKAPFGYAMLIPQKVSKQGLLDEATETSAAPQDSEQVNQTPVVDEDAIIQTTEGQDVELNEENQQQEQDGENVDQNQDYNNSQNESANSNAAFPYNQSNQNFSNLDWNTNAAFNPMMNMPNMQAGWGGFNNMMGKLHPLNSC